MEKNIKIEKCCFSHHLLWRSTCCSRCLFNLNILFNNFNSLFLNFDLFLVLWLFEFWCLFLGYTLLCWNLLEERVHSKCVSANSKYFPCTQSYLIWTTCKEECNENQCGVVTLLIRSTLILSVFTITKSKTKLCFKEKLMWENILHHHHFFYALTSSTLGAFSTFTVSSLGAGTCTGLANWAPTIRRFISTYISLTLRHYHSKWLVC